jgi:predicted NBD/HSP70 family sugar kinase
VEYCLAVDIGGSKIALALVDVQGQAMGDLETHPVPFDAQGIADPAALIEIMRTFLDKAPMDKKAIAGIGLSVCGNIDIDSGDAILVPNLHWRYVPFGAMVSKALGLPVRAATDVRMAALAEHTWGAAKGVRNFIWATVGTGYGGYLYLEDRLYGGYHGFAGNFGHITLDEIHGYPCGCGRRGCFETFVAGPAIARQGQAAVDAGRSPLMARLAGGQPVTTRIVFQAEAAGDKAATEIIEQVIRLISINLGGVVNLLDLEMIVMGGGVVNASPDFVQRIDRRIRDYLMTEEAKRDLKVVKESFPNAAVFGAAADFFQTHGFMLPG